jgi:hypothetical protein
MLQIELPTRDQPGLNPSHTLQSLGFFAGVVDVLYTEQVRLVNFDHFDDDDL